MTVLGWVPERLLRVDAIAISTSNLFLRYVPVCFKLGQDALRCAFGNSYFGRDISDPCV